MKITKESKYRPVVDKGSKTETPEEDPIREWDESLVLYDQGILTQMDPEDRVVEEEIGAFEDEDLDEKKTSLFKHTETPLKKQRYSLQLTIIRKNDTSTLPSRK